MSFEKLCGWHPVEKWDRKDHRSVEDIVAALTAPSFEASDAYAEIKGIGKDVDVFHWEAEQEVLGRILPAYHQRIGDCVSMGWGRAAQDQMLIDIALRRQREQVPEDIKKLDWIVATEPGYAGSRVEIGGGRLRGDGSIGSWHAKWSIDYGVLFRKDYGSIDLTHYDGGRAREWGQRGRGCPNELEPIAKEHPLTDVSVCRTWDAASDALATYNSVVICSSQGFTTTRVNGFCEPSGTWNHCMMLRGRGVAKGGRVFGVLQQSWGTNNPGGSNRLELESGRVIHLPTGCFAVEAGVLDRRILKTGDCHVASGVEGFRRSTSDWVKRLVG